MKTKIFSLLLIIVANTNWLFAEIITQVQIGDLYYNLNLEDKTAEITHSKKNSSWQIKIVNIPSSVYYSNEEYAVTRIGDWAFWECYYLETVTIPKSVTSIGDGPFNKCIDLSSMVVEDDNPTYDSRNNCNAIIETTSNTLIAGCRTTIIPNNVTSIGKSAFLGCAFMTSITIPSSVICIGDKAFSECTRLPVIDNIRYADTYLVEAVDKSLPSYNIKEGTKWIGCYAFQNCSNLSSIEIPSSVTDICTFAFSMCTSLTSITIPNSVTNVEHAAFSGCTGFPVIDNIRYADTYLIGAEDRTLSSYTIKEGTKWIGSSAFSYCSSLISIDIPNSVTSIGTNAFSGCRKLSSIIIPVNVTNIGNYAFEDCSGLIDVTIENGIIGTFAFAWCININSVTFGESVTSIGTNAFSGCRKLNSVTFGESITSIDGYAFVNCTGLTAVTCLAATPPMMGRSLVFGNVNCSQIPLYVPDEHVGAYMVADQWKEFDIKPLSEKVQSVGNIFTNENSSQKIIRNGQVIIKTDDNEYTVTGKKL